MRKLMLTLALLSASTLGLFAHDKAPAPAAPPAEGQVVSPELPAAEKSASRSAAEAGVSAQALKSALATRVKGLKLDESKVLTHVIRPSQILEALSDQGPDQGPVQLLPAPPGPPPPPPLHLDVNAFGTALHDALKAEVAGYVLRLRKNGNTIYTLQWNWARTPVDGGVGWTPQRQMHVASVSKLITAIAVSRLLKEKGLTPDTKIIDYLPTYWPKGPNIDKITFRHLLTHTSGFTGGTDFLSMKVAVAMGVSTNSSLADYLGHYRYRNMNFGLCRILLAVMNGNILKNTDFALPGLSDQIWDAITISAYDQYVKAKVFVPASVTTATLDHPPAGVLAYKFPVTTAGWNSGSLESVSGGAGWHLSADQLLRVMDTFRRKGTILSASSAKAMLDNGFGIDVISDTPAGRLYNKNGLWRDGSGRTEQSLAYFLPEGMELVVLTNSPIGNPEKFFRGVVTQIYLDNLK